MTNSWTRNNFHAASTLPCSEGDFCKQSSYIMSKWVKKAPWTTFVLFVWSTSSPKFSPPHISIMTSYFPSVSNQAFSTMNSPPAIIGVLGTNVTCKTDTLGKGRLWVVPHFSSGIVDWAKRERAWKSPHVRKGDTRRGERKMRDYSSFFSLAAAREKSRLEQSASSPRLADIKCAPEYFTSWKIYLQVSSVKQQRPKS